MVSVLSVLKYITLAIISILLLTTLTSFAFLFSFKSVILAPDFYKQEIRNVDLYDSFMDFFGASVPVDQSMGFTSQDIKGLLKASFTKEWFYSEADGLADSFFAYMNDQKQILSLTISLAEPKRNAITQFTNIANEKLSSSGIPLGTVITPEMMGQAFPLPDEIDLMPLLFQGESAQQLEQAKEVFKLFNLLIIALLIALVIFVALVFLILRNAKAFMWTGANLIISGIIALFSGLTSTMAIDQMFASMSSQSPQEEIMFSVLKPILKDLISALVQQLNLIGIIYLIIGAVSVVLFFVFKAKKHKAAAKPAEKPKAAKKAVVEKPEKKAVKEKQKPKKIASKKAKKK